MNSTHWTLLIAVLSFCTLNLGAQTNGFITNGLIAYYPLAGSATDATGNGNNGVLGSSVTFVTNRFGSAGGAAAFFGDSGSYVALNTTNFNLQSNLTVSVWVNFTTAYGNNGPRVFSSSDYEITLDAPNNNYALTNRFVQFAGAGPTTANIYAGQWTHIVGVISNTTSLIYTNGTFASSGSITEPLSYSLSDSAIGHSCVLSYGVDSFGGSIADVRVYNRSLSAQEVSALYIVESSGTAVTSGIILVPTITVQGTIGMSYDILYTTSLSLQNWLPLTNVFLETTNLIFPDTSAIGQAKRFYEVVPQ
jgi:hypothetical protein